MEVQINSLNEQILILVDSSKTEHNHIAQSTQTVRLIGEDSVNLAQINKVIGDIADKTTFWQ